MEFTLSIRLGNAAMQTPADIALALRETADKIADPMLRDTYAEATPYAGRIRDVNGNTVGEWEVR